MYGSTVGIPLCTDNVTFVMDIRADKAVEPHVATWSLSSLTAVRSLTLSKRTNERTNERMKEGRRLATSHSLTHSQSLTHSHSHSHSHSLTLRRSLTLLLLLSSLRSFVHFVRSFVRSFVHFVPSFVRFVRFVRSFAYFVRSLRSSMNPSLCSLRFASFTSFAPLCCFAAFVSL